ncbi:MAG: hypothetical protein COC10_13785 [Sphingobium sp.]|nr:MAG: hypothetical protein COC10_13785 [Sphingobium sp.]
MIIDEPAMWNLIPVQKRDRIMVAAKALCRSRDADDDEWAEGAGRDACADCDTPQGGSCIAFGLFGQMAIDVIEALDCADRAGSRANPDGARETSNG